MIDLGKTIAPKSDQLNADDLLTGAKTIKVSDVTLMSDAAQPIAIHYDGDNGRPYKPCKSMRRVLVSVWGADGKQFVGRSMTLYCDDKVMFSGKEVGGIRISHMSHLDKPITMSLTATRANKKPFIVKPLVLEQPEVKPAKTKPPASENAVAAAKYAEDIKTCATAEELDKLRMDNRVLMGTLATHGTKLHARLLQLLDEKQATFSDVEPLMPETDEPDLWAAG